ncbi:hypothetical protein [Pelagerythrobacter aerophilus]|uniref:hypothetical protein n=1 Tax=Pelagerythrobacter aerophilus TaxID=2306995 RepID=UPI001E5ABFC2|nr:hypothetical protein [Pelagerythrobacter aerophilus]
MNCLNCLTALVVACLGMIATSSQQVRAQDFTLFEHSIVPPKTDQQPAREYLPAIYQAEPANVSYREGLYMAAIPPRETGTVAQTGGRAVHNHNRRLVCWPSGGI